MAVGRVGVAVRPCGLYRAAAGRPVGEVPDPVNVGDVAAVAVAIPEGLAAPVGRARQTIELVVDERPGLDRDRGADLDEVARVVEPERLVAVNRPARPEDAQAIGP